MYGPYAESLLLKLYILDIIRDFTLQLYLLETGDFISKWIIINANDEVKFFICFSKLNFLGKVKSQTICGFASAWKI